jgi:dipeptidyl aminopeptidase/acylaminoacyl peptidase
MRILTISVALFLVSGILSAAHATDIDACRDRLMPKHGVTVPKLVTGKDLIELRDIGASWINTPGMALLGFSPDKSKVAFQIMRADIATNTYCFGIVVADVSHPGQAQLVDVGGEYMKEIGPSWGFSDDPQPSGIPAMIVPRWSVDGRALAFLKKVDGRIQVWTVTDGGAAIQSTHADADIDGFAWSPTDGALVTRSRPAMALVRQDMEKEGRSGFLYDDRFMPTVSNRPFPRDPIPIQYDVVDIRTGTTQEADANAKALLDAPSPLLRLASPRDPRLVSMSEASSDTAAELQVYRNGKLLAACASAQCRSLEGLWWRSDGRAVYFLRREGIRQGTTSLYEWRVGAVEPRQILTTRDLLLSCDRAASRLICLREGATQPRRLVSIDLQNGRDQVLYDPNPEFASVRLGQVTRLEWKNNVGLETYGDLVLPPDHRPGDRHPLVVVQYQSRGFLRGGTGDDYPIQVLASKGMAVLSFQMPVPVASAHGEKDAAQAFRAGIKDWVDRRSILSALEVGIQRAVHTGQVDSERVGLSGLSDGATTITFALINSHKHYVAAAVSNCCYSRTSLTVLGPYGQKFFEDWHFPVAWGTDESWKPISLALDASRQETPLLMQVPDDEYLETLETRDALVSRGKPVELYVYPDETHVKWQPIHRSASYERSVDWFDFWLLGKEDPAPAKRAQYIRWEAFRSAQTKASGSPRTRKP